MSISTKTNLSTLELEDKIKISNLVSMIKTPEFQQILDQSHKIKNHRKLLFWTLSIAILLIDSIVLIAFFMIDLSQYSLGVFSLSFLTVAVMIFVTNLNFPVNPDEVMVVDDSTVVLIKDDLIKVIVEFKEPVKDVEDLSSKLYLSPDLLGIYHSKSEPTFIKLTEEQEELVSSEVKKLHQENSILITPTQTELFSIISNHTTLRGT